MVFWRTHEYSYLCVLNQTRYLLYTMPEINSRNLRYISILNLQLLYIIRNIPRSDDRLIHENSWNFSFAKDRTRCMVVHLRRVHRHLINSNKILSSLFDLRRRLDHTRLIIEIPWGNEMQQSKALYRKRSFIVVTLAVLVTWIVTD